MLNVKNMRIKRRPLLVEHLQRRDLMTADSLAWDDAGSLRLSFVPDGTVVGDQVSNLDSTLSHSPAGAAWRDSVVKAFQIWSQYAAINVGVVNDSGAPIGTAGPTRGDERFGEIRIAGLPMTADTWAAAVPHDKTSSGSWAGDMFFNTAADWNQHPDDLLRVALHEAGHVLGLPHNDDPTSPMHEHGVPASLTPAASDIALLQQLYGVRTVDANETNKANDTLGDATRMRFSDVSSSFDGTKPLIHYGEITKASDRDIFFFEVPQSHKGTTTVHVESRGLSQLQFRLKIMNSNGVTLSTGDGTGVQGSEVHLTIPATTNGGKYYLEIDAIGDSLNRIGAYAVVAELDGKVAVPYETTLASVQKAHRWFASASTVLGNLDVGTLALSQISNGTLVDDKGGNDLSGSATRIDPFLDNATRRVARTIGSISSGTDVDYYRFRSPKPPAGTTFGMLLQIDSIERNGLMPEIEVRDELSALMPLQFLVNGNGEVKVWVAGVAANKDYTVRVRGVVSGHNIGNYELSATFQAEQPTIPLLANSDVNSSDPEAQFAWDVAKPQLFSLALEATYAGGAAVPIWANIFDSDGRIIYNLTSQSDQFRTGVSVLLMPGYYYLQLGARFPAGSDGLGANIRLLGTADNEPLGPAPIDPASTPIFGCPDSPDKFCYPPDFESIEPFALLPEPPFELPTTGNLPLELPSSGGFFGTNFQRSNFAIPLDTNNDGSVTAVDALLIINQLNVVGSGRVPAPPVGVAGMLDTNNDGYITSLDALLVINQLNQPK